MFSSLTLFNVPIYEVCRKFDKNCLKPLKNGKIWIFCLFLCHFEIFFITKQPLSLRKSLLDNKTYSSCATLSVFNIVMREIYRNFDQNCRNILKMENILIFCLFLCQCEIFFILKTALNSSKKPTGLIFFPC